MASKASIFLLLFAASLSRGSTNSPFEAELRDAIQKNDWSRQVLLLTPKKGQNFEHDLQLARALLQLERRTDSLRILTSLAQAGGEERVDRLIRAAGEMFFSQDTSNLFFEGLRLLEVSKFMDARDRFEQAWSKEPGNLLILTRLIQVEILTGAHGSAHAHLREALSLGASSAEIKAFSMKLGLLKDDANQGEAPRTLASPKRPYPRQEVPFVFTLEALKRWGRIEELRAIAGTLIKEHPRWWYAMSWMISSGLIADRTRSALKAHVEKELKSRDQFEKDLEREMKATQYFWVGYISYEEILKNSR